MRTKTRLLVVVALACLAASLGQVRPLRLRPWPSTASPKAAPNASGVDATATPYPSVWVPAPSSHDGQAATQFEPPASEPPPLVRSPPLPLAPEEILPPKLDVHEAPEPAETQPSHADALAAMAPPSVADLGGLTWAHQSLPDEPREGTPTPAALLPKRIDVDAIVAAPLAQHDLARSLRIVGVDRIALALARSVREHAPNSSRATFVATLAPDGTTAGIDVAWFEGGDADDWQSAAVAAKAALGTHAFVLKGDMPRGARVRVSVSSQPEERHPHGPAAWPFSPGAEPRGRTMPDGGIAWLPSDLAHLGNPETMLQPIDSDCVISFDLIPGSDTLRRVRARTMAITAVAPAAGGDSVDAAASPSERSAPRCDGLCDSPSVRHSEK